MGKKITLEDKKIIKKMYEEGASMKEIAEAIDRSEGSVTSTLYALRKEGKVSPDQRTHAIREKTNTEKKEEDDKKISKFLKQHHEVENEPKETGDEETAPEKVENIRDNEVSDKEVDNLTRILQSIPEGDEEEDLPDDNEEPIITPEINQYPDPTVLPSHPKFTEKQDDTVTVKEASPESGNPAPSASLSEEVEEEHVDQEEASHSNMRHVIELTALEGLAELLDRGQIRINRLVLDNKFGVFSMQFEEVV